MGKLVCVATVEPINEVETWLSFSLLPASHDTSPKASSMSKEDLQSMPVLGKLGSFGLTILDPALPDPSKSPLKGVTCWTIRSVIAATR